METRRGAKLAPPPKEFESLLPLGDMAYQEMINVDLDRENAMPPLTTSTLVSPSPTPPLMRLRARADVKRAVTCE